MIYEKINPWAIVRIFLACQKILPLLPRFVTDVSELWRVIYGSQSIIYGCLRLTTIWRSVRNRKKNPCMWTWYNSNRDIDEGLDWFVPLGMFHVIVRLILWDYTARDKVTTFSFGTACIRLLIITCFCRRLSLDKTISALDIRLF